MDNKITSYGLVGVSLLLALGLFLRHSGATDAQTAAAEREEKLRGALRVLEAQSTMLRNEADLVTERLKLKSADATAFSNKLETVTAEFTQTRQVLLQTTAAIETVKATVVAAQNETRAVESRALAERAQLEKALAEFQRAVKDRDAALANATQANEQLAKQAEQLTLEITRQQATIEAAQTQLRATELRLLATHSKLEALNANHQIVTAQRNEFERQLHDHKFLQEQIAWLKSESARPQVRTSPKPATQAKNSGVTRVQLQPDGSIALVPNQPIGRP